MITTSVLMLLASGLGAFLPFVGALYVFWRRAKLDRDLAQERRQLEDNREQDALVRERDGLLRLVNIDVYLNIHKLKVISNNPAISERYRAFSELYKTNWLDARVRLAQILPSEEIDIIARYYGSIYEIEANSGDEGIPPEKVIDPDVAKAGLNAKEQRHSTLSAHARDALERGEKIRQHSAEYLGVEPSHFDLYPDVALKPGTNEE